MPPRLHQIAGDVFLAELPARFQPVQTFDYISGFLPIAVSGMFKPPNAEAERAALQTEVNKATNTVTVDGVAYRVFKNEGFAFNYELHSALTGLIYYSVTLNCLP